MNIEITNNLGSKAVPTSQLTIQNALNMGNRNKTSNIKEIFKKQNHKAKILSCELYETSLNTNGIFSGNTFNKVTPRLGYNVQKYINPY